MNKTNGVSRVLALVGLWLCFAGIIQAQPGDPPPEQKDCHVEIGKIT